MLKRLLEFFFFHLYHSFAWGYDLVAWVVSFGRWNLWGETALDLLPPGPILELGFGPGHLQQSFFQHGLLSFGLDESRQMSSLARRRNPLARLVRARAEAAPFISGYFQSVVAVFPAPYIFKLQTAQQIARQLRPGGRLILLLAARPTGSRLSDRFIRTLFLVTGESPGPSSDFSAVLSVYQQAGFQVAIEWREQSHSNLLFLTGNKV